MPSVMFVGGCGSYLQLWQSRSTTIDLCLAVFPWAHFRTTKAAVKMRTATTAARG
jgi:hypothetical protein